MADHPVQITIGATLAASVGAAVKGAQSQLNRLGATMAEIGNKQSGIKQLDALRSQTAQAAQAMRAAKQKVSGLGQAFAEQQTRQAERAVQARQALAAAEQGAAAAQQKASALIADELQQQLAASETQTRTIYKEVIREIPAATLGRPCLSGDALRLLDRFPAALEPEFSVSATARESAGADETVATDTQVAQWAADVIEQHERERARCNALIGWHLAD